MAITIQLRRDTAANWAASNPVLAEGEIGLDLTNDQLRIGDGVTAWSSITPYTAGGGGIYWSAWSPSLTGSVSNPTKGAATEVAVYSRSGNALFASYRLSMGIGGADGSGDYRWDLPVSIDLTKAPAGTVIGQGVVDGTPLLVKVVSATTVELLASGQEVGSAWFGFADAHELTFQINAAPILPV